MEKLFKERTAQFGLTLNALKKRSLSLSWLRVSSFLAAIILITVFANAKITEGITITAISFLVLFFYLMKKHIAVKKELEFTEALFKVNEEELSRLEMKLSTLDDGAEFINPLHEYHIDLDIFGRHSLFQLINRAATVFGRKTMAKWLSTPSDKDEILLRQQAAKEVAPMVEWRQNIQASGRAFNEEKANIEPLLSWLKEPNVLLSKKFYPLAVFLFPLFTLVCIGLASLGTAPIGLPILAIFINIGVLATVFNYAGDVFQKTIFSNKILKAYEAQIAWIEKQELTSPLMKDLKSKLQTDGKDASVVISQLQYILDNLHNRANMMYQIFNMLFIMDVYWLIKAEKWREKTKADIQSWFEAIGEIEAVNSLGAFYFSNPETIFPTIETEPFVIKATQMGHPMLNAKKRVSNDFDFSGKGGICLITGSNMSGKSTFLRTVGVNSIMALMGAPVCAESMNISKLQVFTSMRTQDDLEESVSSFYAELKRLKQLLGSINTETPTLFMIDEVLKGTNSEDRHTGAIALIRQLNKSHAFGFVSTHDLTLGKITTELQGIKNYSFNSVIENDDIIFDYTLTPGLCKSFNATKLMQKMGIEIND
ncbi:MutS-related protein [Roseivirga echinicomitans]